MWISRDKIDLMENEIKRLFKNIDVLNDRVCSLERINKYAGEEPTFKIGRVIEKRKEPDDNGIGVYVGYIPWKYQIYLYINKREYVIDAVEIPNEWVVDQDRSSLKIVDGFAYVDIFVKGHRNGFEVYQMYHYISKYADGTKMRDVEELDGIPEKDDISKREAVEEENEDPYRFHDLRKDPNDLPEKYGEDWVLVKRSFTGMDGKPIVAEFRNGKWFSDSDREVAIDDWTTVIGWFKIYDPCLNEKED